MSQILNLRERRAAEWERAKSFLDTSRDDAGLVSPENAAIYEKMEGTIVAMGKEIDRLERQATIEAEMNAPTSAPIYNAPAKPQTEAKPSRASGEYKNAFWNAMRMTVPNYEIMNALKIGTEAEGGVLAPDEYEKTLIEGLTEENMLRRFVHIIRTSSGERKIPVVSSKGSAAWTDEGAARSQLKRLGTMAIAA